MKKILSVLLVVMMLAGLTVCAFAEDTPSVEQAKKAEAAAAEEIQVEKAVGEKGNTVTVYVGEVDNNTPDTTKNEFEGMIDDLVVAKAGLDENEQDTIPAEVKNKAADGATVAASEPVRVVATEYPVTITLDVDESTFVGMMVFVNGKWEPLKWTKTADGKITFTLEKGAIISTVTQNVTAA